MPLLTLGRWLVFLALASGPSHGGSENVPRPATRPPAPVRSVRRTPPSPMRQALSALGVAGLAFGMIRGRRADSARSVEPGRFR